MEYVHSNGHFAIAKDRTTLSQLTTKKNISFCKQEQKGRRGMIKMGKIAGSKNKNSLTIIKI